MPASHVPLNIKTILHVVAQSTVTYTSSEGHFFGVLCSMQEFSSSGDKSKEQ